LKQVYSALACWCPKNVDWLAREHQDCEDDFNDVKCCCTHKWPQLLARCFAVRMPDIHVQAFFVRNKAQINQVPVQNATYNATTTSEARHATGAPHHTRCYSVTCVWTAQKLFLQVVTMGIFGLGGPEIAVIAGVAVLIFGEHLCSAKAT